MATKDELERRPHGGLPGAQPLGMTLTPEQMKTKADDEWRQGAMQRKAEFGQGLRKAAGKVGEAYGTVIGTATVVPRTIKGVATGEIQVYDRPFDYSTPEKDAAKLQAQQKQASQWAEQNPQDADQAQESMQGIADRAVATAQQPFSAGVARNLLAGGMPRPSAPAIAAEGSGASIGGAPGGTNPAAASQAQPIAQNQWGGTGIGVGRQGGEIVGRVNADGVAEFSNLGADQQAASGRQFSAAGLRPQRERVEIPRLPGDDRAIPQGPAGSRTMASGTSVRTDAEAFADRGSAANVGRGLRGYLSHGEPGDAKTAIARFEGANAERRKLLPGLTVAGNRGPLSLDEIAQEKLGLRSRAVAVEEARQRQDANDSASDFALRERELNADEQRSQLEGLRAEQELAAGSITLEQQRRIDTLQQQYLDADETQRPAIAAQIRALSGKDDSSMSPRDYIMPRKVPIYDAQGMVVGEQQELVDLRTGRVIAGEGQSTARPPQTFEKGKVYRNGDQRAEFLGGDVNDPKNWREI